MQNFMKTIVNAVKCWVEGKIDNSKAELNSRIDNSKADWSESNESADSYIKNRPFYDDTKITEVIAEETVVNIAEGDRAFGISISKQPNQIGQRYAVVLDGYYYLSTELYDAEGVYGCYITVDDVEINVQFNKISVSFFVNGGTLPFSGEHIVAIKIVDINLKTIDEKFIPQKTINAINNAQTTANGKMDANNPVGTGSFSMNRGNGIVGKMSVAIGQYTTASADNSYAEGYATSATSDINLNASPSYAMQRPGYASHAEGYGTVSCGTISHAEGNGTKASGDYSHAEGYDTTASGGKSHAEGYRTKASGGSSHAEGYYAKASGGISHAEGNSTDATGGSSHAEGYKTTASGDYSHAEGNSTDATGGSSHAEGYKTTASGDYSHAEGYNTTASGGSSHAEGYNTTASGNYQHVQGQYNIQDDANDYAHIVGNGTSNTDRSNAHTLDWNGVGWYQGGLQVGGNAQDDGAKNVLLEGDAVPVPENAEVGQLLAVKAVDENGKPSEWKVVYMPDSGGNPGLSVTGATVGQTVKISAVDENGVPTAWEPVEFPEGGGDVWEYIGEFNVGESDVERWDITEDANGNPIKLKEIYFSWLLQPAAATTASTDLYFGNPLEPTPFAANVPYYRCKELKTTVSASNDSNGVHAKHYPSGTGAMIVAFRHAASFSMSWSIGRESATECIGGLAMKTANSTTGLIGAGSTVKIWGVRA